MVEIEAESPHDCCSEVVEGPCALDLDISIDPGWQPDTEDVSARAWHAVVLRTQSGKRMFRNCALSRRGVHHAFGVIQPQDRSWSMRVCGQPSTKRLSSSAR